MNTGMKITAFAALLAGAFGVSYGVGKGVGPIAEAQKPSAHASHASHANQDQPTARHAGHGPQAPSGLQITEAGYTLDLQTPLIPARKVTELRFAIRRTDGQTVKEYKREHDKELHLILSSRDLTTFQHLHPDRAADGTWSTPVNLPRGGDYRLFADFTPSAAGATGLTLGADLAVTGNYAPTVLSRPSHVARVDGYTVTLDGDLQPGRPSDVTLSVSKDGRPVTDLQPYLGSYGHLVALRSGDLAYLHVHPHGEPGDGKTKPGPAIAFSATAPSSGTYRLFLDFQHEGKVRTAAFTVRTGQSAADPAQETAPEAPDSHGADGHEH
jgi:hypothetical protein